MTDRKRTIEVDFVVDDKDKRKLKGIGDEAQGTVGKFDSMKTAVGGLVAGLAVQQVADFAIETAKLGEQANIAAESAGKVLGPALDTLHTNLEETRLVMGLNTGELDSLVAQYGLLTDSLGLADDAQATFIEWLITTGGELAAYKGDLGLSEDAVSALGGALRGEFDSLETFGIKVNQAAVNERKLKLEADPANASLSDQQLELMALQQIINEKATPAIGSLANAQDGLAGKTNAATTRFEDLKIEIGQKLLPVGEDLLSFLLEAIDGFENLANPGTFQNTQLAAWLRDLDNALGPVDEAVGSLIDSFKALFNIVMSSWRSLEDTVEDIGRTIAGKSTSGTGHTPSGPGRQHGGPVHAGQAYTVGEAGRETFVPGQNGRIVPAGGVVNNITINAGMGADPNAISRAVVQALQRYERSNGAIPITTRAAS